MEEDIADEEERRKAPAPPRTRKPQINSPLAWRALICFCVGFALMCLSAMIQITPPWSAIIVLPSLFLMTGSAAIFTAAIFTRDAVAFKQSGLRFSLRALFVLTTAIAAALSLIELFKHFD